MPRQRDSSEYIHMKFRMREALRVQLSQAAGNRGGSMNDEAVSRIQQSFIDEEHLFKDQSLMALVQLLVGTIRLVETQTSKRWTDDRTREAIAATILAFINGDRGVPFHKPARKDNQGKPLNDAFELMEAPQTAIDDVFRSLLKMRGVPDSRREVIIEMVQTFSKREEVTPSDESPTKPASKGKKK